MRAMIDVREDGRDIGTIMPEKRSYPVEGEAISDTAIRTTGFSDLYRGAGRRSRQRALVDSRLSSIRWRRSSGSAAA